MVKDFEHKHYWALVLGGSSGLGLATAKKLAAHGCNIIAVHRNSRVDLPAIEQAFEEMRNSGIELISFNMDALNPEKRQQIISAVKEKLDGKGKIRTLIHSIAKGNLKPMAGRDEPHLQHDDLMLTLDAMAVSLYDWTKIIFENGLFAEDARVISFTSEGNSRAVKHYAAVSAAKAALDAITRNIALEFAPFGIRANCVQAGVTETTAFKQIPGHEQIRAHAQKRNPYKRITRPEDVANVVYLLCRDEAAWINGSIIIADGGEHIN